MSLAFVSPTGRIPSKVADKHSRSKLDLLRQELCIPIVYLNQLATRVCGREIRDFSVLSPTENRCLVVYIKSHTAELEKECRRFKYQ
jgi:hypothetical protein